jgi:20S proteasome alpha/beta subunit
MMKMTTIGSIFAISMSFRRLVLLLSIMHLVIITITETANTIVDNNTNSSSNDRVYFVVNAANSHRRRSFIGSSMRGNNQNGAISSKYDRSITTFDPNGRLLQVEYSIEATKRGNTIVTATIIVPKHCSIQQQQQQHHHPHDDVLNDDDDSIDIDRSKATISSSAAGDIDTAGDAVAGIYVAITNTNTNTNHPKRSHHSHHHNMIHRIDDHIYILTIGLQGDARRLVHYIRAICQQSKYNINDESMTVHQVATHIATIQHQLTKQAGARPFGCTVLIIGYDTIINNNCNSIPSMYRVGPGGTIENCWYCSIGGSSGGNSDSPYNDAIMNQIGDEKLYSYYPTIVEMPSTTVINASTSTDNEKMQGEEEEIEQSSVDKTNIDDTNDNSNLHNGNNNLKDDNLLLSTQDSTSTLTTTTTTITSIILRRIISGLLKAIHPAMTKDPTSTTTASLSTKSTTIHTETAPTTTATTTDLWVLRPHSNRRGNIHTTCFSNINDCNDDTILEQIVHHLQSTT